MDVSKILKQLRAERDQIDEAIRSLERLAQHRPRQAGRIPDYLPLKEPSQGGTPPAVSGAIDAARSALPRRGIRRRPT